MTGKVIDFLTHANAAETVPLQVKAEVYQRAIREWSAHLSANELVLALAIIDRTVGWGKKEHAFSTYALIEGDHIYAGLPLSRATLFRALARLDEIGMIGRRRDKANCEKVHFSVNINWKPDTVNLPKRLPKAQTGSHSEINRSHGETDRSHSETVYTVENTVEDNASLVDAGAASTARDPITSLREKLARSAADAKTRQAERKLFGGKSSKSAETTSTGTERAWRDAILEAFPHNAIPAWGVREKAQAKQAAAKWLHKNQITFPAFVAWAATNWTAIMRKQFKWMTRAAPPAIPAWGFFIAQLHQFAECWAEHKLEDWLSEADRTEIEKIMARGVTWEHAVAQLAEVKAKGVLRDEMIRVKRDAEITRRAAELTMERARKLADYAGNAPVHPRSRAAMRMKREAEQALPPPEPSPGDFTGFVPAAPLPAKCPFDDE